MRICKTMLRDDNKAVSLFPENGLLEISAVSENILRCVYTGRSHVGGDSPAGILKGDGIPLELDDSPGEAAIRIRTGKVLLEVERNSGRFRWYSQRLLLEEGRKELTEIPVEEWTTGNEEPLIRRVHTVDGDRNFVENLRPVTERTAYRAKLHFCWKEDEQIHGLGQGEEGIYNYRGKTQYLYQHNMRIPMPWILSDQGYAILFDCGCLMTFNDDERGSYVFLDTVEQLDYYFIAGDTAGELICGYRRLTGKAGMLPKWAFGYIQSKERYENQDELIAVAREYRERGVGLDCVVQDWKTWTGENWGEKLLDPERFPDKKQMRRELHGLNVHSMVSVWPNMNYDTENCREMQAGGFLLNDLCTYDAFSGEARDLYWKQAEEGLYRDGFDSWWCDSTEPFSGPDWGGAVMREPWERYELVGGEHKKFLGAERANLYALFHAKGMYENQRRADTAHRMLNLTRSGYAGIQRYGTVLWSGDISASWTVLRKQVTEGLNMALSGIPYWTLDCGGFFVVRDNWQARGCGCSNDPSPKWFWNGDYEEGLKDENYRELYVRWLQMCTFLPMMRSHGTDVPREIWRFGNPGEPYYDAIAEAISLRYRFMPYIYSLAGNVWLEDDLMMRPLLLDFPEDQRAAGSDEAYMFGRDLLIFPVTAPMDKGGADIRDTVSEVLCYLPGKNVWYDFFTGDVFDGGKTVGKKIGIDHIPVFVRAGSILPMETAAARICWAQQETDQPIELRIYPGADGSFCYYEDSGDGYMYEQGEYNRIRMHWEDAERMLRIEGAEHSFPGGIIGRKLRCICSGEIIETTYEGKAIEISFRRDG